MTSNDYFAKPLSANSAFRRWAAMSILLGLWILVGLTAPASGITIISKAPNTEIVLGLPSSQLEFENPLTGAETVYGYKVLNWRDADYSPGPPPFYDDWSVSNPGAIDGDPNEIWMRAFGQSIWTTTLVPSKIVSIHLPGDGNDGLAQVMVDGVEVARLDMNSSPPDRALIIVKALSHTTHTIQVNDLAPGHEGNTDVHCFGAAALTREFATKWNQPPQPTTPPNLYYGWNERSFYEYTQAPPYTWTGIAAADDWVCTTNKPVTTIRWWGSYIGWQDTVPPPSDYLPNRYLLTIWSDVPAGIEPFSHPGQVLWQYSVTPPPTPQFVGFDYDPQNQWYESCYFYSVDLPPEQYFCQTSANTIYWLSIAAVYDRMPPYSPQYKWGWKTRPREPTSPAPDDAVRIIDPILPNVGMTYANGEPIWFPTQAQSWDMAFELASTSKWSRPPDLTPQGIDVRANRAVATRSLLADDWQCTNPGPISSISIWGSWYNDVLPPAGPSGVTFYLSIHSDMPGNPSMPGPTLWTESYNSTQFNYSQVSPTPTEGWMNPPDQYFPVGDHNCYRYNFPLRTPFTQTGTPLQPVVYWLDVQAQPTGSALFGWKTSWCQWNDRAVWANAIEPYSGPWSALSYPLGHPKAGQALDFAFAINSNAVIPETKWSQPPKTYVAPDAFNGWNVQSTYGIQQIAADDWVCNSARPVSDIHWWGSFLGWTWKNLPYSQLPERFRFTIWTDVPAGLNEPFSHPGVAIWEADCDNYSIEFVGWDFDPRSPGTAPEACFEFGCYLPENLWFHQEPGTHVYWLSIAAMYDMQVQFPWGWKTTPRLDAQSPDDGVTIFDPLAPLLGSEFHLGEPLEYPAGVSWDLAFELTSPLELEPQADLGDAPDRTNTTGSMMTAYPPGGPPGVPANYPTVYAAGSPPFGPIHWQPRAMAYLGAAVTRELEADTGMDDDPSNNILPPLDQPNLDGADDGVAIPLSLPHCMPTTMNYTVTIVSPVAVPLYVNVWFDWNRDGDWDDVVQCPQNAQAPEWAVQNVALPALPPGTYTLASPPFVAWHPATGDASPIWMRITLSEQRWPPGSVYSGGSGPANGYEYGETEDYYFLPQIPPALNPKWIQLPHDQGQGFDAASSYWWQEQAGSPVDIVVADDFISDGRPVRAVRWWGSYFDDRYAPGIGTDPLHVMDGWFLSFHWAHPDLNPQDCPPSMLFDPPPSVLAIYFAPVDAVFKEPLPMIDCLGRQVYLYTIDLSRCCLLCSEMDPRFPQDFPPGHANGFHERGAARYWLDVQAVTGVTWTPQACSYADRILTGHLPSDITPDGQFWGWHTSPANVMPQGPLAWACTGEILDRTPYPPSCWQYGNWTKQPWLCPTPPPPQVDMAFMLYADPCTPIGDLNHDGAVNGLDIQCMIDCVLGYTFRACWCGCGDMNGDHAVTYADITPFVNLLLSL